jgi:hypothetical protein
MIEPGSFAGCNILATFEIDSANPQYTSANGCILTKDGKTLVQAAYGYNHNFATPAGVNSIGPCAFFGDGNLMIPNISASVTSIGEYAFMNCKGTFFTSVEVPESVTSIGIGAFSGCSSLTSVTIKATTPPALAAGSNAFTGLKTGFLIHVPNGVDQSGKSYVTLYQEAQGWSDYASQIGL